MAGHAHPRTDRSVKRRLLAGVSVDLDDAWTYHKTRGLADWPTVPTYLPLVASRVLDLFARHRLRGTLFIVGRDAERLRGDSVWQLSAGSGCEIGNHSYKHEPWLHRYSTSELETEVETAELAIHAATGVRPVGFRGPGYSSPPALRRVLAGRGYRYDASPFPTFLAPISRWLYFRRAALTDDQRAERATLGGTFTSGFGSNRPGRDGNLVVIPVTTFPLFRLPIHVSYLQCLNVVSCQLAVAYFRAAVAACRASDTPLSLVLHPTDLLGREDSVLPFFPAMQLPLGRKLDLVDRVLAEVRRHCRAVTLAEWADEMG